MVADVAARSRRPAGRGAGLAGGAGWPVRIAVTAVCVLWVISTAGTVITSFRTSDAANNSGWWRALTAPFDTDQYTLSNYRFAWTGGMASAYLNSIAVTSPAVALPVLLAAFAAYALTFMRMPGADVWYGLIVSLLIVPALVALPPLLRLESDLGIVGTYPVRIPADRWLSWSEVWRRSQSGTASGECAVAPGGRCRRWCLVGVEGRRFWSRFWSWR